VPEGDTIFRQAATLRGKLVGQTVTALVARGVTYPRLAGSKITAVQARGKHLLIDVAEARVHVHLGMSGRLRLDAPSGVTTAAAARASLAIITREVAALWWRAPTVEVLRAAFAHAHPALRALGPDVLGPDFAAAEAVTRARQRPATTPVGALLLDQRVACGIGNVYKSEALFLERLDPFTTVGELDDRRLLEVYARARELMQRNLGPGPRTTTTTSRPIEEHGFGPRGAARLHVYRRAGHPCRVCGAAIAVAPQGDPPRRTYYCPRCQDGSKPHSKPHQG
jgi:endonuclease-8